MASAPPAPPPQTFPYDYLFKVLIIGDASVGKVRRRNLEHKLLNYFNVQFDNSELPLNFLASSLTLKPLKIPPVFTYFLVLHALEIHRRQF